MEIVTGAILLWLESLPGHREAIHFLRNLATWILFEIERREKDGN